MRPVIFTPSMTVAEYCPSDAPSQWKQPDHLSDRPSFKSRRLGRVVSAAGVEHLSWEEVDELFQELTQEMHALDARMNSQKWPLHEYRCMRWKRQRWGAVHQALNQRRGVRARVRKRRNQLDRTVPEFFIDIAKQELPQELYAQILDSAKQRQAEAMAELASMADTTSNSSQLT